MDGTKKEVRSNANPTEGEGEGESMSLHVRDASLDYKGRLPLRASTGSWKATFFVIVMEFAERLSFFGISTNLITYMTKVMHQDLETAVNSVNVWAGVTKVLPLLGGFLGDAYIGGFPMVSFSAILYVLGLSLLTMSQYIPSLKPCGTTTATTCEQASKAHQTIFYTSLYVVSVATGGYRPCLQSFGADQFDDNHTNERKHKMSFFNWWNVALTSGIFLADTLIVYFQDYVSWGVGYIILAVTMVVATAVFAVGRPFFRYRAPRGSPLTPLVQVLVAAFAKRNLSCPFDPSLLYEAPMSDKRLLTHTDRLRFFDKAAIITEEDSNKESPWRLATITQIEELKLIINMVPIWLTCLIFGVGLSQATTLYIKQGSAMNRRVNKHFEIPAASLYIITALGMMLTIVIYDRVLQPRLRRAMGNERGISILARMGIGMVFLVIAMMASALVERKRLDFVQDGKILSVRWLVPQFLIIGIGDGFSLVAMQEYFYDQVPDSMRSLGAAFYICVIGVGSFLSSFIITVVNSVTSLNGGKKWIGKSLNDSRLDYFYWFSMVFFVLNFCAFIFLAKNYTYKSVQYVADVPGGGSSEDGKG